MSIRIRYYGFEAKPMFIKDLGTAPAKDTGGAVPSAAPAGACLVVGAHACMLKISRVFGLAPLRFERRGAGFLVTLSQPLCIYSYVLVTVLIAGAMLGVWAELRAGVARSERMSSLLLQGVASADVLVVAAAAAAGVYGAPRRLRGGLRAMDTLAEVDSSISAQHAAPCSRRICGAFLALLALFAVFLADDCYYHAQRGHVDRTWEVVRNFAAFYVLWILVVVLELQFSLTACRVRGGFRALNGALAVAAQQLAAPREQAGGPRWLDLCDIRAAPDVGRLVDSLARGQTILTNQDGSPRLALPPEEAVRRLAALHGALCGVVRRVDAGYGLPLVVILISILLHLIVTPYFVIADLNKFALTTRFHLFALQLLWCAFHLCRLLAVVEPCHYTADENKRTAELVCRLLSAAPAAGPLPARLALFSRQLLLRAVRYTPLGLCTLDRPLVASIIGAVTTYLVILIQFQSIA